MTFFNSFHIIDKKNTASNGIMKFWRFSYQFTKGPLVKFDVFQDYPQGNSGW